MTKTFQFNENGVCLNPNIAFDIKTVKPNYTGHFEIRTAQRQADQKWATGCSYSFPETQSGGGVGVFFESAYYKVPLFDTEKEAVLHQLNHFIGYLTGLLGFYPQAKSLVNCLKDERNNLKFEQFALF